MMKMNKKAIAAITVLMMLALCLTGCSGSAASTTSLVFASGGTSGHLLSCSQAPAQVWKTR